MKDDYEGSVQAAFISSEKNEPGRTPVLFLHGFIDYFYHPHVADAFHNQGYNFYALELRKYGHALMEHQHPNYCRSLDEYFEELDRAVTIISEENPDKEIILLGHSTGGLISCLYGNRGVMRDKISHIILNSPFLEFNKPWIYRKTILPIACLLASILPWGNQKKAINPLTAMSLHKDHYGEWEFNTALKPIKGFPAYFAWAKAISKGQKWLKKRSTLTVPTLVMHSSDSVWTGKWIPKVQEADIVLNVKHIKNLGKNLGSQTTVHCVEKAMHDIFLSKEEVRKEAFNKVFQWLRENS